MRLANVCPPQQHWFKEELASNAVVFASMADNDSQLPGADNEVEEEEELEANEVEDEEEECEAEEEGPTAAASSPPASGPSTAASSDGTVALVATQPLECMAASPGKRSMLSALGSALKSEGYTDALAAQIKQCREEREAVAQQKRRKDIQLRNEERKRQRLLQKLDRVPTSDLVLVINHRAANCERREQRATTTATPIVPVPKATTNAKAKAAKRKAKAKSKSANEADL